MRVKHVYYIRFINLNLSQRVQSQHATSRSSLSIYHLAIHRSLHLTIVVYPITSELTLQCHPKLLAERAESQRRRPRQKS
jgi:hypothetical protein